MAHTLFPARPRIWRALPEKRGQSKISGDLINPARDVTPFLFAMRRGRNDHFFTMRTARLSRLAGGRAPKGRRGLTSTGTTPDASTDNINGSEKGRKSLTCMGPRPFGPSPLQGGGVLPLDGQTLCRDGFQICRNISAGSMKLFPTIFYCSGKAYHSGNRL